jgi:putative transposase
MSERHACGLLGIAVSSCRYRSRTQERERTLRTRLVELAHENPRYGSPRLYVLLRRETRCNHKRVERIYREVGLSLRRKKRKRLVRQRVPMGMPLAANEEWALDFVADALASARSLRILAVVDAFTRECLALETDTSMGSLRVVRVLERLIAERGAHRAESVPTMALSLPAALTLPGAWNIASSWSIFARASRSRTRWWRVLMVACARSV